MKPADGRRGRIPGVHVPVAGRAISGLVLLAALEAGSAAGPAAVYTEHCASCHGADRLGAMGPALLPQNLSRLSRDDAYQLIARGRAATQMPGFGETLSDAQISALVDVIYAPPASPPTWKLEDVRASHQVFHSPDDLPDKPVHEADPLNLFLVVEVGDHHVSVLDGDRLAPIHRFESHFALHGGPKYSPDGRYVYLASRDGWVSKFDLYSLRPVAEVRAGINTRNIAVSADGRSVVVANYLPGNLVLLDARTLEPRRLYPASDRQGEPSRVSAVYSAPPRAGFVAALKDVKEVWEVPYPAPGGPPPTLQDVRRISVPEHLDDFFFDPGYRTLVGASRDGGHGVAIDLDSGAPVATIPIAGMPHLGSGITWEWQGRPVMATPNLRDGKVSVIAMDDWSLIREIDTLGPGFFMRSHERTPYAWVDVFFGPHRDVVHVIDKRTLEIVETLRPAPGKTAAHVEFDRDGEHALLSIWEMDGAVVVYDADTLAEVKRLPMVKPSGKYNVHNKITHDRGTSH